jgi:LPS-assembly protein
MQGDLYYVNDVPDPDPSDPNQDGFTGRLFPQAMASWRYPLVMRDGKISTLVEPIVQTAVSPNGSNKSIIPNEDSLAFELDETNLFSPNRFPGYDRVSSGKRVDYGVKTGLFDDKGRNISLFLGQSYSDRENQDSVAAGAGLDHKFSDYVGKLEINPNRFVDINYRFRIDSEELETRRSEIGFNVSDSTKWGIGGNYIFLDSAAANGEFNDREEISTTTYVQLDDYWFFDGTIIRDLGLNSGTTKASSGLTYADECINVTLGFTKDFTRDAENEPDTTIFLRMSLKHLGMVATSSNSDVREYKF